MDYQTLIIIGLVAFGTSIVSAIAGYGGFLMLASLSLFFDIKTSIVFSSVFFFFLVLNKALLFRKTIDWEFVRYTILGVIPFIFVGFYLFEIIDGSIIKYLLALTGTYLILENFFTLPRVKNFTKLKMVIGGSAWGFLSGVGSPGSVKVMLLRWKGLDRQFFVGTGAMISLMILSIRVPAYIYMDYLVVDNFLMLIPIAFIVTVGTLIGKNILHRISTKTFEYVVLGLVFLSVLRFLLV